MINLLPPQEQALLALQKQKKLVVVLGAMAVILMACLALILLSLKFYMLEDVAYRQSILDSLEKNSQVSDAADLKKIILGANSKFLAIDAFYQKGILADDALTTVLGVQRPNGLYFTALSLDRTTESTMVITIAGASNTRDNLLLFKQYLEGNPNIHNVYFPPDSWIKPTQVDFSITLDVAKNISNKP